MTSKATSFVNAPLGRDFGASFVVSSTSKKGGPVGVNPIQPPVFTLPTLPEIGLSPSSSSPESKFANEMQRVTQEILDGAPASAPLPTKKKKRGLLKTIGLVLVVVVAGAAIGGRK